MVTFVRVLWTGELARSPHIVRSRMDRGKIITTCAEIRHFHQREVEAAAGPGGSAKFSAELLRSGLKACEAIDADPTGANWALSAAFALSIDLVALLFWLPLLTEHLIRCRRITNF